MSCLSHCQLVGLSLAQAIVVDVSDSRYELIWSISFH